ncbi:MAG: PIN domain-containing protein [Verrucomicrobiota bacterium]|nr:PIN domain-containing protein [Chthoniobacterales bacterium]MDQ3415322.1 PIN domain-containing protein [Verrucomicrobiota bacterium]
MRALLDLNVLIALLDADHVFHQRAHSWWATNAGQRWASCPLTENGLVRIMCHPGYSQSLRLAPSQLIRLLQDFVAQSDHEFWPDNLSLRDTAHFMADRIHGGRQVTDIYLLGLATSHQGRLVTFDESIPITAVSRAKSRNLLVI